METALTVTVALLFILFTVLAGWLAGLSRDIENDRATTRRVCGDLVDGQAKLKARALHIETQLGRTMRATGVPGQDP